MFPSGETYVGRRMSAYRMALTLIHLLAPRLEPAKLDREIGGLSQSNVKYIVSETLTASQLETLNA